MAAAAIQYLTRLVDAHRPAQSDADRSSLPQTVFYHPDWGYSHTNAFSSILRDKQTKIHVTWLPRNYV